MSTTIIIPHFISVLRNYSLCVDSASFFFFFLFLKIFLLRKICSFLFPHLTACPGHSTVCFGTDDSGKMSGTIHGKWKSSVSFNLYSTLSPVFFTTG